MMYLVITFNTHRYDMTVTSNNQLKRRLGVASREIVLLNELVSFSMHKVVK